MERLERSALLLDTRTMPTLPCCGTTAVAIAAGSTCCNLGHLVSEGRKNSKLCLLVSLAVLPKFLVTLAYQSAKLT